MKKKILVALVVLIALVVAFFYNDTPVNPTQETALEQIEAVQIEEIQEVQVVQPEEIEPEEIQVDIEPQMADIEPFMEEESISEEVILEEVIPEVAIVDEATTCTLMVTCETLLANMDLLDANKWELVPEDGIIYSATEVIFYAGESVFNVLQRELKLSQIHLEFVNTPVYNSAYIEGIHNLYEFDAGERSGWMYQVNGIFPSYGCSQYLLEDGDVIHWQYTCDLGADLQGTGNVQ
ncbi:DUF4430 domain-containing protein [Chakrabartyella piscis]|uniref:DUF4430 domain-containing protein n=1 Tax=Chakrabartyella piscis TaxID=2918914 RepID=UPI0029585FFC|nr:DUF4430 domain-containing protein [Chakrabartyella piscis]